MALRTVYLHGEMAERWGPSFKLDVDTLAEAVRALGSQLKGFAQYIPENDYQCVRGETLDRGMSLPEEAVTLGLGKADLHIVPVIRGSGGRGGLGKIIAGVLLAGLSFGLGLAAGGLGAVAFGSVTYGNLAVMGVGLALAGLSQMLTPQQKTPEEEEKTDSHIFNGAVNVSEEGGSVPVVYGRWGAGSTIISSGISTEDIAV